MDFAYIQNYLSDFDLVKNNAIEVTKECFQYRGTLNRTKFWTYGIVLFIIGIITSVVVSILSFVPIINFVSLILCFIPVVLAICPMARRLRDAGYPHWLTWFNFLCCLAIVPFILCFFPSVGGNNQQPQQPQEPTFCPEANQPTQEQNN